MLVTNADGTAWVVYGQKADSADYECKLSSDAGNAATVSLGDITAKNDTAVHVYLYYEGKDAKVTTRNLQDNKLTATAKATVFFTATADNK